MAISLCSNDYQNIILRNNNDKPVSYLGIGDFEVHTLHSLKMFSKSFPHMIYPKIITKLKKSGKKSVKINFITRCKMFVNEFMDYKLTYGNFILNY